MNQSLPKINQSSIDKSDLVKWEFNSYLSLQGKNLNHTLNNLRLNNTSTVDFDRLELAESNIMHLNNTVNDFKNDINNNAANIASNKGKISMNQADLSSSKTEFGDIKGISYADKINHICTCIFF